MSKVIVDIIENLEDELKSLKWYQFIKKIDIILQIVNKVQYLTGSIITHHISLKYFETPLTDIRSKKVELRDELAIQLVKKGFIEITDRKEFREDVKKTEVTLIARIKSVK